MNSRPTTTGSISLTGHPHHAYPSPILILIIMAMLAVTGLLTGFYPWLMPLLLLFVIGAFPFVINDRFRKDPLEIIFLFIIYFLLGIGARGLLLQLGMLENTFNAPADNELYTTYMYLLSSLALLSLYAGYYTNPYPLAGRWLHRLFKAEVRNEITFNCFFSAICAIAGLISFYLFYSRFSYLIDFGENPSAVSAVTFSGGIYYITMLAKFPIVGALLSISRRMKLTNVLLFIINFAMVFAWYAVMGRKQVLLELLVGVVIVFHYRIRRIPLKFILVSGIIIFLILEASFYYRAFGLSKITSSIDTSGGAIGVIFRPILYRSYHADVFLIIIDSVKHVGDLQLGKTMGEIFYFFIPRSLWAGKPMSFGYTFGSDYLGYSNSPSSFSPSMIGEAYLNFFIPGIFLVFFLVGKVLRSIYTGLVNNNNNVSIIIYSMALMSMVHMVEGPLATHIVFTFSAFLPFLFYFLLRAAFLKRELPASRG